MNVFIFTVFSIGTWGVGVGGVGGLCKHSGVIGNLFKHVSINGVDFCIFHRKFM